MAASLTGPFQPCQRYHPEWWLQHGVQCQGQPAHHPERQPDRDGGTAKVDSVTVKGVLTIGNGSLQASGLVVQ
jgi:hypothetical protein